MDISPILARAACLAGIQTGLATPPQELKAAEIAATLQKWKAEEGPGGLMAATKALRAAPDAATRLRALDLVASERVAVVQLMDDIDGSTSSDGAAVEQLRGMGEAGARIGQIFRPGRGKTEGIACGFKPTALLKVQDKDVQWGTVMVSAGVLVDRGITFDALLAAMREKSLEAVAVIAMAAQIAGISWDAYARVVPQRVETKVGQGIEFTILNPQAETNLNALQKMWGAALIDVYPGDLYFSQYAG